MEKFLSQISVYNQIRGAIDGTIGRSLMFDISYKEQDLNIICKRNGPAFTITVEKEAEIKEIANCFYEELEEELFHCDFTFALYCPKFPRCAQGKKKYWQEKGPEYFGKHLRCSTLKSSPSFVGVLDVLFSSFSFFLTTHRKQRMKFLKFSATLKSKRRGEIGRTCTYNIFHSGLQRD